MVPPHELKNKEFSHVVRGYSIPEVDEYIDFLMERYTELYRENDSLEQKLKSTTDELEALRAEEETIRSALVNAQKAGKQIVADANVRADKILRATKEDCLQVLAEFRDKTAQERKTLVELKLSVAKLKQEMFEKYQQHIQYLEQLVPEACDDSRDTETPQDTAERMADGVADIIKDEYNFDLKASNPADNDGSDIGSEDTLVFTRVNDDSVQHVSLDAEDIVSPEDLSVSEGTKGEN